MSKISELEENVRDGLLPICNKLDQLNENKVGNDTDTYTGTSAVQQIVTLTQAQYDAIGTKNSNTLYVIVDA